MPARITAAEARKLGISVKTTTTKNRRTAKGPWHTRCKTCSEEFRTEASEDAHVKETHHARYELVLG